MSNIDEGGVNPPSPEDIDAWVAMQTELADAALEEQLREGTPFWMALEPEFYGQDAAQVDQIFAEVPDEDLRWVDIRFMQKVLFRDGEFYGEGLQSIDHLLFNETLFTDTVRNPQAFEDQIRASTRKSLKKGDELYDPYDDKVIRSGIHGFENKVPLMGHNYQALMLEKEWLDSLEEAAFRWEKPVLSEATLLEQMQNALDVTFTNLVATIQVQTGWDPAMRLRVERALGKRLFSGDSQERQKYALRLLHLAIDYNKAMRKRIGDRLTVSEAKAS